MAVGPIRALKRIFKLPANEVIEQVRRAGYLDYLSEIQLGDVSVLARTNLELINRLRADRRFAKGRLHRLHPEVGERRVDFRAHTGELGEGSLQIVIGRDTSRVYCDVDRFSPYSDVAGFVGHAGEVINHWWKRIT